MRPSPATWPLKNQLTISSDMIRLKDYLPSLKIYFIHWTKSNFSYETKSSNLTSKKSTDHIQWYDQVKRLSAVFENLFYTLNKIKLFLWDQVQQLDLWKISWPYPVIWSGEKIICRLWKSILYIEWNQTFLMRPSPATWPLKNQLTISSDMIRLKDYLPSLKIYFIHWTKSNFSYETKSSNLTSKKSTDHIEWYDQVKRLSAVFENLFYTLNEIKLFLWDQVQQLDL